jgi:hypothetical protein
MLEAGSPSLAFSSPGMTPIPSLVLRDAALLSRRAAVVSSF